jgi:hypothetical protein
MVSVTVIISFTVTTAGDGTVEEFIVSVSVTLPEHPFESVAETVMEKLPVCVGVPLRTPATKVMPVGKVPVSANVMAPTPPVSVKVTGG